MTDTEENVTAPGPSTRGWDWRPKLRWFAAEIVVVVAGVLIALALNAWWGARQADAKQTVYLRQLVADLRETERIMANRDSLMAWYTHRPLAQLAISFGTLPRPPRDSVEQWLVRMDYMAAPLPVLGTAEALVASGDFGAVRDNSLRSAILRYLDVTREQMVDQIRARDDAQRTQRELGRLGRSRTAVWDSQRDLREAFFHEWKQAPGEQNGGTLGSPDWQYPFPYDAMSIYESQEFFEMLDWYRLHIRELQRIRTVFAESAAELREQVTAVIDE